MRKRREKGAKRFDFFKKTYKRTEKMDSLISVWGLNMVGSGHR